MEVREEIKKIKIRIRKVEGRTRYYTPDVLKDFDEKEFKDELRNLRNDFEDCEDEIVRLITDLEEEDDKNSNLPMIHDLESKLENLRECVRENERNTIKKRTLFDKKEHVHKTHNESISESTNLQEPHSFDTYTINAGTVAHNAPNSVDNISPCKSPDNVGELVVMSKQRNNLQNQLEMPQASFHKAMYKEDEKKGDVPTQYSENVKRENMIKPSDVEIEYIIEVDNELDSTMEIPEKSFSMERENENIAGDFVGASVSKQMYFTDGFICPESDCRIQVAGDPEVLKRHIKKMHPNLSSTLKSSDQLVNKQWISVDGANHLPFSEFGGKYKYYKCLSAACDPGQKVRTEGVNRNSFLVHCSRKHQLKITSIRQKTGRLKINNFDLQPNKEVAPPTFKTNHYMVSDKIMKNKSVKRINVKRGKYGTIKNITTAKRKSSVEICKKVILTLNESDPSEPDNSRELSKSKEISKDEKTSSNKSSELESEKMKNTLGDNIIKTNYNECNFLNSKTESTSWTIFIDNMNGTEGGSLEFSENDILSRLVNFQEDLELQTYFDFIPEIPSINVSWPADMILQLPMFTTLLEEDRSTLMTANLIKVVVLFFTWKSTDDSNFDSLFKTKSQTEMELHQPCTLMKIKFSMNKKQKHKSEWKLLNKLEENEYKLENSKISQLCKNVKKMKLDKTECSLLIAIVIFSDNFATSDPKKVENIQTKFVKMLQDYVQKIAAFSNMLALLTDLNGFIFERKGNVEKAALDKIDTKNRSNQRREHPGTQIASNENVDIRQEMERPNKEHDYSYNWTFHADILKEFLQSDIITEHQLLKRLSVPTIYTNCKHEKKCDPANTVRGQI